MTSPSGRTPSGPGPAGPPGNNPGEIAAMYHRAVTGKRVPPDDKVTVTRLKALVNRYGSQTAAAQALGVGRSTRGGWLAKKNKPSPASLGKIVSLQRRVREQEAAAATYGRRAARLSAGANLHITGVGGPKCTSPDDATATATSASPSARPRPSS